jgi:uncharacterized small protein (DUF1192 family)
MAAEDEPLRRKIVHDIGQDLGILSVDELSERIGLLQAEIERLEREKASKSATRLAAESLFKVK